MALPLSIVILSHNEEINLPGCLESVVGVCSDIHLVDSGSTDNTLEIARLHGVPAYHHSFCGFGQQRNWAIDHLPHAHPWVFHLDADERFTPALVAELERVLRREPSEAGFFVPSKLMMDGHWLKYSGGYPVYQVRLFHRRRLRFEDCGHGQRELTDGTIGFLHEPYIHEAFGKGLDDWFSKHAKYARLEAEMVLHDKTAISSAFQGLFSRNPVDRRRSVKALTAGLPCRPFLRMAHCLLVKRGFLDGKAGWTYARLMAAYEAMFMAHVSRIRAEMQL
jgi:glycosyltransferase involved in cell wall biosynthesis